MTRSPWRAWMVGPGMSPLYVHTSVERPGENSCVVITASRLTSTMVGSSLMSARTVVPTSAGSGASPDPELPDEEPDDDVDDDDEAAADAPEDELAVSELWVPEHATTGRHRAMTTNPLDMRLLFPKRAGPT